MEVQVLTEAFAYSDQDGMIASVRKAFAPRYATATEKIVANLLQGAGALLQCGGGRGLGKGHPEALARHPQLRRVDASSPML